MLPASALVAAVVAVVESWAGMSVAQVLDVVVLAPGAEPSSALTD